MSRPISPTGIRAELETTTEPQTEKSHDTASQNQSQSPRASIDGDSSEGDGLEERKEYEEDGTFAPIACAATNEGRGLQKSKSNASRSMERSWSLNDGISLRREELSEEGGGDGEDNEFVVGWEEGDALYPRNMNKGRKWLIVIIVSMGSLCV
jgi:hypothetical protein